MRQLGAIIAAGILFTGCHQSTGNKEKEMFNTPKKETNQPEKLSLVDYNIVFDNKVVDSVPVELLEIGELQVPSGQIVVCDPLVVPDMAPLNKTVKPGKYPIKIYIAKTEESGGRYALAKLEFSPKKADKWVLAVRNGEDVSTIEEADGYFGFPVDAGLGGFFDYKAGIEYNKFIDDFLKKHPDGNIYDDFFAAEFKKNAREPNNPDDIGDWINFTIPNSNFNITMFHSGYGDGYYPAYWGMTKDNEIVSLVIDFLVLFLPEIQQ